MPTATGYPSSSVVSFLKQRGFASAAGEALPYFDLRKQIFQKAGLTPTRTNEYRGTSEENTALFNYLARAEKTAGTGINPENLFTVVRMAGTPAPVQTPALQGGTGTAAGGQGEDPGALAAMQFMEKYKLPSGKEVAKQALADVTGGPKFALQKDQAVADKEAIAVQAQADKESLISKLASRGLIFSGAKKSGLASIDADEVAKTLGVDRKFALMIATGLESSAEKIVKDAQAGQRDAIASLRSLGYDINPITGRVEPTLAARNADATNERFAYGQEATQSRFEEGQAATQARFEASQAATQARFNATQARLQGIAGTLKTLGATSFNLRAGLTGLTAPQAADIFNLPASQPPPWFKSMAESTAKASVSYAALQTQWAAYKKRAQAAATSASTPFDSALLQLTSQIEGLQEGVDY